MARAIPGVFQAADVRWAPVPQPPAIGSVSPTVAQLIEPSKFPRLSGPATITVAAQKVATALLHEKSHAERIAEQRQRLVAMETQLDAIYWIGIVTLVILFCIFVYITWALWKRNNGFKEEKM